MSIFDFIFRGYRPKKAFDTTIPKAQYKDGRYKTSKHCIEQMQNRKITKGQLHENLRTKPLIKIKEIDNNGRKADVRFSNNKTRSVVNPTTKTVASVRKYRDKELKKEIAIKSSNRRTKNDNHF